ncbi:unnamed protein product [Caenorhabditis auriculariae]|uniref:Transposase Tc1-like domain-containing protein n=1 Tax=Caenorhabditis auriculariae TaxID=2777116 RepID=A0A8S1H781_9PELO|nr:unnamed protein product [Caenorhabditis auriculariae]
MAVLTANALEDHVSLIVMTIGTFLKTSRTNPRLTAPAIRREVFLNSPSPPSVSTVKRRLNAAGIMGRRPVNKPLISEKNRAARVKWAKEHLNWTRQDWNKILWSDESKFLLFGSDGIQWLRCSFAHVTLPARFFSEISDVVSRTRRMAEMANSRKTSRLIAGAVSLGLVLDVFKNVSIVITISDTWSSSANGEMHASVTPNIPANVIMVSPF